MVILDYLILNIDLIVYNKYMSDEVVFPPSFWKKLEKALKSIGDFFKDNWFWGAIFAIGVIILIIVQQIFFLLLGGSF